MPLPSWLNVSGVSGTVINILYGIGIFIVVGIIIFFIVSWWRNKIIYVTPVRLIRYLENGTKKEVNGLKGGKVKINGVTNFRIRIPKKIKKHILGYVPDFSKADADGRLTFIVIGDGTLWQQLEEKLQTYEDITYDLTAEQISEAEKSIKELVEKKHKTKTKEEKEQIYADLLEKWLKDNQTKTIRCQLIMKPIPTDIKTVTVNNLQGWRAVLDKQKLTAFGIAIGGFIIMVIAHLISLYIQTKIKCPAAP